MIFNEDFFLEENRCDFTVTSLMKRAWAAQMEVLEVIDNICKKNNIVYFVDSGTLLGTIRHKGFIPWDDDLDIALLREEYNKLIKVLPSELPDGFVMTGMHADDSRLREACDSSQTRVMADEQFWSFPDYMNRFHCFPYPRIGIDIFPLDYIPDDEKERKDFLYTIKDLFALATNCEMNCNTQEYKAKLKEYSSRYGINPESDDLKHDLWILADEVCSKNNRDNSSSVANLFDYTVYNRGIFKTKWYEGIEYRQFENMTVPVPKGYDEILKSCYGDYMVLQKNVATHDYPFYAKQEDALKEMFMAAGITTEVEEFCNNWARLISMSKTN